MLQGSPAVNGFAVPDLDAARRFYEDVLGLRTTPGAFHTFTLHATGTDTLVYRKPDHEPAGYTVLNFEVADIEAVVDALAARGVATLRYAMMPQDERGIVREDPLIAWIADPAGNVFALMQHR